MESLADELTSAQASHGWPPLKDLIKKGVRVMFSSATDYGKEMQDLIFTRDQVCHWKEPDLPIAPFPNCTFADGSVANVGVMLRPMSSEIQMGPFNAGGHWGPNVGLINESTLPELIKCNVNYPSPDNVTPKRLESTVWTWAKGEPARLFGDSSLLNASVCASIGATDGRWREVQCGQVAPDACRGIKDRNLWVLGSKRKGTERSTCPPDTEFWRPENAFHNAQLQQLALTKGEPLVWINVDGIGEL